MPQFNVTKITNYLDKYKNQLDELYDWKPNVQGLAEIGVANETELAELQSSTISNFQKDEKLKSILSKALNSYAIDSQEFETIALWIIRDWGRINTGLDTMTGGRLSRLSDKLKDDTFMLTYGDAVADVDIERTGLGPETHHQRGWKRPRLGAAILDIFGFYQDT